MKLLNWKILVLESMKWNNAPDKDAIEEKSLCLFKVGESH